MEKQRRKSKYRLFIRLLILGVLFFNAANVFSQSLREKINSLEISPAENQDLYIKSDIKKIYKVKFIIPSFLLQPYLKLL